MRIWVIFTLIILVIITSVSLLYLLIFDKIEENRKYDDLKVAHEIVLRGQNTNPPLKGIEEMEHLKFIDHFIAYKLKSNDTIILNLQGKPENHKPSFKSDIKMWMSQSIKQNYLTQQKFEERYDEAKFIFIVSTAGKDENGIYYLISYMEPRRNNQLIETVIFIGILFIFIGFIAAKFAANNISKPLIELENYTIKIAHKDWAESLEVTREDEVGRLQKAMNRMKQALKHSDEEEKLFLQSISHDLKTPVMVIMSHAQAIIDGMYIETVEDTAQIIKEEALRLERKIKQILYLNSLNYVLEHTHEVSEIDLKELIQAIVNRFRKVNPNIIWQIDLESVSIHGNLDKIQVAIENILDNQLRYAKEKIHILLKQQQSDIVLEIYNDGPHIDSKHITHIFDNFYKDKTGNFGLGLAITKKIVDFHKGIIYAKNQAKGVSFILNIPITK